MHGSIPCCAAGSIAVGAISEPDPPAKSGKEHNAHLRENFEAGRKSINGIENKLFIFWNCGLQILSK